MGEHVAHKFITYSFISHYDKVSMVDGWGQSIMAATSTPNAISPRMVRKGKGFISDSYLTSLQESPTIM